MPKLGDTTTEKLYLPSTQNEANEADRAWVVIKDRLLIGDVAGLVDLTSDAERAIMSVTNFITEWNFTEDGTANTPAIPVTADSVRKLDQEDFLFLANKLGEITKSNQSGLGAEEKKASSVTSTVAEASKPPFLETTTPIN